MGSVVGGGAPFMSISGLTLYLGLISGFERLNLWLAFEFYAYAYFARYKTQDLPVLGGLYCVGRFGLRESRG